MIVLRTPKGWTGPSVVDGVRVVGTWRSHQVPLAGIKGNDEHLRILDGWLRSYRPDELFDDDGRPTELVRRANPEGPYRMSGSPHANGGLLTVDLDLPDFREYALDVPRPAYLRAESTRRLGELMRDIYRLNPDRFRLFCPDETNSNRLGAVFEVSDRAFAERVTEDDVALSRNGRVMEVPEHNCHGWLEGYILTGRHGWFATYEAFAMVSASQTIQHSKWLEEAEHLSWRANVPSLNILLTSTAWRNDHNGFSHQGPGLIQNVITQRGSVGRVYLPPDANTLLSVADHCLRSRSYVNLVVIDKQPQLQWLSIDDAIAHCARGAGVWEWAGTDDGTADPDIVLACAGDVVTMETVAAASILRDRVPQLRTRVVNVVDLMAMMRPKDHPHGMDPMLFNELFTDHVDVVFAFHGYPAPSTSSCTGGRTPTGSGAGVHRGGDHNHPVRHGGAQQGFPIPLGDGCAQEHAEDSPERATSWHGADIGSQSIMPTSSSTSRTCPTCATGFSATGPRRVEHVRCPRRRRRTRRRENRHVLASGPAGLEPTESIHVLAPGVGGRSMTSGTGSLRGWRGSRSRARLASCSTATPWLMWSR